jgi:RNA recognition motif. (a.k.a. RRM, RBD, or RNP domain)
MSKPVNSSSLSAMMRIKEHVDQDVYGIHASYKFELSGNLEWSQTSRDALGAVLPGGSLTVCKSGQHMRYFKSGLIQSKSIEDACVYPRQFEVMGVRGVLRPISDLLYEDLRKQTMTKVYFKGFPQHATRSDVARIFGMFGSIEYSYFMCAARNTNAPYKMGYVIYDKRESVDELFTYSKKLMFEHCVIHFEEYQTNKKLLRKSDQKTSKNIDRSNFGNHTSRKRDQAGLARLKGIHENFQKIAAGSSSNLKVHQFGITNARGYSELLSGSKSPCRVEVLKTVEKQVEMNIQNQENLRFNVNLNLKYRVGHAALKKRFVLRLNPTN